MVNIFPYRADIMTVEDDLPLRTQDTGQRGQVSVPRPTRGG